MNLKEAKALVQKIKNASFTDAVAIMKQLERKNSIPQNWWFPERVTIEPQEHKERNMKT